MVFKKPYSRTPLEHNKGNSMSFYSRFGFLPFRILILPCIER